MGNPGTLRNANQSAAMDRVQHRAARLFARSPALARRVRNAGEVADFVTWTRDRFGRVDLLPTREALWQRMADQMGGEWRGYEFGVAWGYASDWWLRHSGVAEWHGFDRFTGLPRAWHGEAEGAYDAGGKPPDIDDPRVTWHVGDIERTLSGLTIPPEGHRLLFFDLDLYEPTAYAWGRLAPHLRPGDLIYFDEAMAPDERRVLDELVTGCDYVGSTSLALALRVS